MSCTCPPGQCYCPDGPGRYTHSGENPRRPCACGCSHDHSCHCHVDDMRDMRESYEIEERDAVGYLKKRTLYRTSELLSLVVVGAMLSTAIENIYFAILAGLGCTLFGLSSLQIGAIDGRLEVLRRWQKSLPTRTGSRTHDHR